MPVKPIAQLYNYAPFTSFFKRTKFFILGYSAFFVASINGMLLVTAVQSFPGIGACVGYLIVSVT